VGGAGLDNALVQELSGAKWLADTISMEESTRHRRLTII